VKYQDWQHMSSKELANSQGSQTPLFGEIKQLIDQSRRQVAQTVNSAISLLYWKVGKRLQEEVLLHQRAEYGKEIIHNLAQQLEQEYGKGWSKRQIHYCLQFAEAFPEEEIVHTVCAQLTWSHIRLIIPMDSEVKRMFYIEICQLENWSVRGLQEKIDSMLFERTAISKKPEETIKASLEKLKNQKSVNPDLVFRDPYVLDFLGLSDTYSEKDLEDSILNELQKFIGELGSDFAFLARQKRIGIDQVDYYIDLLFYHRRLKSLVAIDLKLGHFKAEYKGQMELYLRWLEKHESLEGENPPIGLILCASKNQEHIELLQLDHGNIKVAEYMVHLPPIKVLEQKLHRAIEIAQNKLNKEDE
jgi:predicted nuclease of restriction endonuclease-like (RecB) superfamily